MRSKCIRICIMVSVVLLLVTGSRFLANAVVPGRLARSLPSPRLSPSTKPGVNMDIQQNMYGYLGGSGFNANITPKVLSSLNSRTNPVPLIVSLNEVCSTTWTNSLWASYFGQRTYVAEAHWAVYVGGECGYLGNVVAVLGTAAIRSHAAFNNQATGQAEQKGWVCVASNFYNFTGCSAHTTARTTPTNIRQTQLWEYSTQVNVYAVQNIPVWAAGDLNLNYGDDPGGFYWWYFNLIEADNYGRAANAKRSTTNWGAAYDYIFRRTPNTISDEAYIFNTSYSDHHWYQMYC